MNMGFTLAPTLLPSFDRNREDHDPVAGKHLMAVLDWWPVSMYVNTTVPPFDNPDVRWALSLFMNHGTGGLGGLVGANQISRLPMPPYPPLQRYFTAVDDLLQQYDTSEFNPEKAGKLLEKAGYTRDADGMWVDAAGETLKLDVFLS